MFCTTALSYQRWGVSIRRLAIGLALIPDIDSRVSQVISLRFNKDSFWNRGKFPSTITNTTTGDVVKLLNPWAASENNVAPFDQRE